ncbi:MAG: outer membrane lipoprotein carrier protein LolA [Bacteroidales bacterium]|nr:outer membrane lipoprotein carrier protein LolA [Bacteroidales bacterium]
MKKIFYILLLIVTVPIGALHALPPDTTFRVLKDTSVLKRKISEYTASLQSLESNFVQHRYISVLTVPVESKGYFCYKNDAMIRWEYIEPFKYLMIINNETVYVSDEGKNTAFNMSGNTGFGRIANLFDKMFKGNVMDDKKDFSCGYFENDLYYKMVLNPKNKNIKNFFIEIHLYFEKSLFSVERIIMKEQSGDITDIIFHDRKLNGNVPDDKFIIK